MNSKKRATPKSRQNGSTKPTVSKSNTQSPVNRFASRRFLIAILIWLVAVVCLIQLQWFSRDVEPSSETTGDTSPAVDYVSILSVSAACPDSAAEISDEVLHACEQTITKSERRGEPFAVYALALMRLGKADKAEAVWQEALKRDSTFVPAMLGLATVEFDRDQIDAAIGWLEKALSSKPETEAGYPLILESYRRRGDSAKTLTYAKQFVRHFPDSADSHHWLGQALLDSGDTTEAIRELNSAIKIDSTKSRIYFNLARAYTLAGDKEQAAGAREQFAKLKAIELEQERETDRNFDDVKDLTSWASTTYQSLGQVNHIVLNSDQMAEACWLRGLQFVPGDTECRRELIALYKSQQRFVAAESIMTQYISTDRDAAALDYEELAAIRLELGNNMRGVVEAATKAIEIRPSARSLLFLSVAYQQQGKITEARNAIDRALQFEPNNSQLLAVQRQLSSSK